MRLRQYQVDAFADRAFEGNPAAVCQLDGWLDDALLQAIAEENNLSETAFFVAADGRFALRWFTPVAEVDLCGHATLATAHVIFEHLAHAQPVITFVTRSGELHVRRQGRLLEMDFPAIAATPCALPEGMLAALGRQPLEVLAADDYLVLFASEADVLAITPNQAWLCQLDLRGVIVSAPGSEVDFVSRFFAPKYGIPEDPVTGSAHCVLTPFWADRLGKTTLTARQVSRRGGNIGCTLKGERVALSGSAVTVMESELRF